MASQCFQLLWEVEFFSWKEKDNKHACILYNCHLQLTTTLSEELVFLAWLINPAHEKEA